MTIDDIIQDLEQIRDARRPSENTAKRVGSALIEMLQYLNADTDEYLHKNKDDVMKGLLTLMKGAVVGDGKIHMNPDGSIICDNIRVNGSAIFDELVFNHQNVLEGDTYFTDKGIIDRVEALDDGTYRLTFRKEYDKDIISFHETTSSSARSTTSTSLRHTTHSTAASRPSTRMPIPLPSPSMTMRTCRVERTIRPWLRQE